MSYLENLQKGLFLPCKKELGVIKSTLQKNMGGIMSNSKKMGRGGGGGGGGGFVREGFSPAPNTDITRSCPASQISSQNF